MSNACLTGPAPATRRPPGSADQIHNLRNNCVNPRLDLDNQGNTSTSRYLPENINLDNPRAGEIFQVAVDHVSQKAIRVQALVNVYCGGKLRGSYRARPRENGVQRYRECGARAVACSRDCTCGERSGCDRRTAP